MVRAAFIDKDGLRKGEWSEEEDQKLRACVQTYGNLNWRQVPQIAGLNRCGKSCRLRWVNYLKPNVKRGNYSMQERELIKRLHDEHGNKWSTIAKSFPGRTDNEIKNYWHTHFNKERKRNSNKKSGHKNNETNFVQEKASSEPFIVEQWMDFTNTSESSSYPNSSLVKQEKSEIESSDVYIFDSSSSSSNSGVSVYAAAAVDLDFESILDQEWSGMSLQPLDVVEDCKNLGASDDGAGSLPGAGSISGFQESYVMDDAYEETGFSFYDDYCGISLNQILGVEDDNDLILF